jgi:TPR repeat protein
VRPASNQTRLETAAALEQAGEFHEAMPLYRALAEEGDAHGQFCLANMLCQDENTAEGFAWMHKAAEQGLGFAQHNLGLMYQGAVGVKQDLAAARHGFTEASRQDVAGARDFLERLDLTEPLLPVLDRMEIEYIVALEGGLGAQPKRPPAEIIAFTGNAPHAAFIAMAKIGWMELAEDASLPEPRARLFRITEAGGRSIGNAMTILRAWPDCSYPLRREQWESRREAARARYKAGDFLVALSIWDSLEIDGDDIAPFHMGYMISRGEGTAVNDVAALSWFRMSAEDGFGLACEYVAHHHQEGRGVRQDFEIADFWYRKALEHQGPTAARDRAILAASRPMLPLLNALTLGELSVLEVLARQPADTAAKPGTPKHALYLEMERHGWLRQVPPPADWPLPDFPIFQSIPLGCKAIPQLMAIHARWLQRTEPLPTGGDDRATETVRPLPAALQSFQTDRIRPRPESASAPPSLARKIWNEIERGRDDDVSSLRRIATPVLLFAILLFAALGISRLFTP